jgi:hypothetical protein
MMIFNAIFLIYTGALAPVQICLWNYEDACNAFPTLYFDVFVDSFFLVAPVLSKFALSRTLQLLIRWRC